MSTSNRSLVNLFFEIGMLSKIPRSGYAFLGSGVQSVAEHSYRMTLVALFLSQHSDQPVDEAKLLKMCLFHDLPEARTGDLNYVQKLYLKVDNEKVISDIASSLPEGHEFKHIVHEFEENKSLEAQIAHDADQIEMLLELKYLSDLGNVHAIKWFDNVAKRVRLPFSKPFIEEIRNATYDGWWLVDKDSTHWQHGKGHDA